MDNAFIQAMVTQQDKGNRINGTFTSQAYSNMIEELNTSLRMDFNKNHLKNRLKTLKECFSQWYDMFRGTSLSGFSWNSDTQLTEAEDEVWDKLIDSKPEAFPRFSNNGIGGRGVSKCCSYKKTTAIICSVNIVVALYVFQNLYTYSYSYRDSTHRYCLDYTSDQVKRIKEKVEKRDGVVKLPPAWKQKLTNEIIELLRGLNIGVNTTLQHEAIESWRMQKLKEAKRITHGKDSSSTTLPVEAGMLARTLEFYWAELSHEIGLWMPVNVINNEHDDKPGGEDDFDDSILAGRRLPSECNAELHTDYGGQAVKWGLTHHKESAYECCQACINQAKNARFGEMKCNIWVYCPAEEGCHSPDIYQHKLEECWLKYAEEPKVNFKDEYSESYRRNRPNAPLVVPWVSGVLSS
ncbi:hypothetical protein L1987_30515 [Smallanthus sonchifolius]|uniref:Uncharacterized protein n=1 Tax=Smallanthus sonchifolius TaxID=185202 RepID=A0ACB9I483_9ASTR|nr:hypothetical protein L1987_30515 [Smallanthus sonchifolius]